METSTNEKKAKIEEKLNEISDLLGLKGESGTEAFAQQLMNAADSALEEAVKEHDKGLCLNCIPVITDYLYEHLSSVE